MAINTSDEKEKYEDIKRHLGHNLECVSYGVSDGQDYSNVAIECRDCEEILLDAEHEDYKIED